MNLPSTIPPSLAFSQVKKYLLVDVCTPAEFAETHIEGSVSLPLSSFDPQKVQALAADKTELLLICRSGNRARQAAEKLNAAGVSSFSLLEGGLQAWEAGGFPVVRGEKMVSLERQVRIVAGFLVFTGSFLGYFVHPAWMGLAGFVGAGLVFAGVTDTCGMGMFLARMPWNNRAGYPPQSSCSM